MDFDMMQVDLDAHDELVRACVDGSLEFLLFLAAYGDLSGRWQSQGVSGEVQIAGNFKKRMMFHALVASVLTGLQNTALGLDGVELGAKVGLMRLRSLVARYPSFEAVAVEPRAADYPHGSYALMSNEFKN